MNLRTEVAEVDQLSVTALGKATGLLPATSLDLIESALSRPAVLSGNAGLQLVGQVLGGRVRRIHRQGHAGHQHEAGLSS